MNLFLKTPVFRLAFLLFFMLYENEINGQAQMDCFPGSLCVAGDRVNFREGPGTKNKIIRCFQNGEKLIFLDEYDTGEEIWYHVKSEESHDSGYIHSDYVLPLETAYLQAQDCDKLQNGYWYGISMKNDAVFLNQTQPKLEKSEGQNLIFDDQENNRILICSQTQLKEGKIEGRMNLQGLEIRPGDYRNIFKSTKGEFDLMYTGEAKPEGRGLKWKNRKIILQSTGHNNHPETMRQEDISNCFDFIGEGFFYIYFIGDLNSDGIPELIISEASTNQMILYYFRSDKDADFNLVSKTVFLSKC